MHSQVVNETDESQTARSNIKGLIRLARQAQRAYQRFSQQRVDEVVTALAWTVIQPEHNQMLSQMAVQDTGLGRLEDKIVKMIQGNP